ncbi:hypothetical protein [Burkholderia thailandensis]|uniref:hypothetical protein n=1 Tax=Burkholderia thailandensis TaxID=57975 RepID=UPI001F459AF7|nr:hypothetical protein [Burkholderia thailandensis]
MTTTENSRADALTVLQELSKWAAGFSTWQDEPKGPYLSNIIADARRIVSASTSSQPAAAPSTELTQAAFDDRAVDRFSEAMKAKLADARAKGRRGWQHCEPQDLSRMLHEHVEKGDPRDVANFCAFLWNMGEAITGPAPSSQPAAAPIPEDCDVRNILLDVVPGEDGEGQEVYARNVADVERLLSEMGEKLDAAKQPAPSPVDERAAFDSEVGNIIADAATRGIAWMAFKVGARYARAASANDTGAEEAAEPYDEGDIERHFDDHGFYLHGFEEEDRANFFEAALALVAGRSPAMAAEAVASPATAILLAEPHTGMRVDYSGLLKQARHALKLGMQDTGSAEMLRQLQNHLTELGQRWYAGDTAVVDELLQLYCVEKDARDALAAAPQPAQADARVGLTAAARATIMDACQSISRNADGVKAGCAIGDEWPDAEDKAFYDAELQLLARLVALLNDPGQPEPRAEVTGEQPSLTNPLTPYGMLVRALRIVAGTTLMDMAQHLGRGPAELSAIEFGRKPVRDADIADAAHFFACAGIQSTTHALTIAARAGGQHADQA